MGKARKKDDTRDQKQGEGEGEGFEAEIEDRAEKQDMQDSYSPQQMESIVASEKVNGSSRTFLSDGEKRIKVPVYEVEIPNLEVRTAFETILASWFGSEEKNAELVEAFHNALLRRDKNKLGKALRNIALSSFGEQDVANHPKRPPENFYHGIVLGLSLGLQAQYSVKSNYQAGDGIYDLTLTPKFDLPQHETENLHPIVMEFKVKEKSDRTLEDAAKRAYDTIILKKYTKPLTDLGIPEHRIWCVGISFYEKYVSVVDATGPAENEYGDEMTAEEHGGNAPAVKTEVSEANAILIQPASVTGFHGDIVELKVKTSDSGASYQWMYFEEGTEKWQKSRLRGNKTDTLSVPVNNVNTKRQYMCRVVFRNGRIADAQSVKVSCNT